MRKIGKEYRKFNIGKQAKGAIAEMHGVASSIMFDGEIDDKEIEFVRIWLALNEDYLNEWPLSDLYNLMKEIAKDGIVDKEERVRVFDFFSSFAIGIIYSPIIDNIFEKNPTIVFKRKTFLFTGDLVWGDRDKAQQAVKDRGGIVSESNSFTANVNYLVVGEAGSESWKYKRYGTKIETAMEYLRAGKTNVKIIKETDFLKALLYS